MLSAGPHMRMRSAGMMASLIPACCSPAADSSRLKMDRSPLEQASHLCGEKGAVHDPLR